MLQQLTVTYLVWNCTMRPRVHYIVTVSDKN